MNLIKRHQSSGLQLIVEYAETDGAAAYKLIDEMQRLFRQLKPNGYAGDFRAWLYDTEPMERQLQHMEPVDRLTWIDEQLAIVKGQVPTPTGYTATPADVKAWIVERKKLLGET